MKLRSRDFGDDTELFGVNRDDTPSMKLRSRDFGDITLDPNGRSSVGRPQ